MNCVLSHWTSQLTPFPSLPEYETDSPNSAMSASPREVQGGWVLVTLGLVGAAKSLMDLPRSHAFKRWPWQPFCQQRQPCLCSSSKGKPCWVINVVFKFPSVCAFLAQQVIYYHLIYVFIILIWSSSSRDHVTVVRGWYLSDPYIIYFLLHLYHALWVVVT